MAYGTVRNWTGGKGGPEGLGLARGGLGRWGEAGSINVRDIKEPVMCWGRNQDKKLRQNREGLEMRVHWDERGRQKTGTPWGSGHSCLA